ncbi:MAG: DUF2232 domain-containing protein [Cyanophyceae cyanobacterium]
MPSEDRDPLTNDLLADETNWVDLDDSASGLEKQHQGTDEDSSQRSPQKTADVSSSPTAATRTIVVVETAFLASAGSLIWLINYYFPLGLILRVFFPLPIALIYLRRGSRAAWMAALVSGLLLSVLMGPTRSIVFLIPYGLMGVQLGALWSRRASWIFSITIGAIIGTIGFFFRFWLFSILLGEDLWIYAITQITELTDWIFMRLGLLAQPGVMLIQLLALLTIIVHNFVYLFAVHLVALLILDRLGNPISRPPQWVRVLLDYD